MAYLFDSGKRRVEFDDAIKPHIDSLKNAFQNNVNMLYDKLVSLGSTPASKTPQSISSATQAINDSIYNKLISLGQTPSSKIVADLNAKIQKLTEITWEQTLTIEPVTYQDSEVTKTLPERSVPLNSKNVVSLTISYTLGGGYVVSPFSMGDVNWYNANGGLLRSDIIIPANEAPGAYSKTFTPPSGATRANIEFVWGSSTAFTVHVTGNFTLTTRYQTKVLR